VAWEIDAPESSVDLACCYPYGLSDVEALLQDTQGYWKKDSIGVSQGGRALIRLSNEYGTTDGQCPGLYLVARQHSGETPGSWVLDGFLRRMATLGDTAPVTWVVPLANIDGIETGDHGKDNFPYDLNRAWTSPAMRHEVLVFQRDIKRWAERCRPVLGIDFHAPSACEADGIFCQVPDALEYPVLRERTLEWTAVIKTALTPKYAAALFSRVADYDSRWELPVLQSQACKSANLRERSDDSARPSEGQWLCSVKPTFGRHFWSQLGVSSFVLETPYALTSEVLLTRNHYREVGRRLAGAVIESLGTLQV
jgi:hypothetical protein